MRESLRYLANIGLKMNVPEYREDELSVGIKETKTYPSIEKMNALLSSRKLKIIPSQCVIVDHRLCRRIETKKIKPKCQTVICCATQNLRQQVSNHVFSVAEYHLDAATLNHCTDQVITDGNVSDFAESDGVGSDAQTSL